MPSPALTVGLPIYNAERFLVDCIRSMQGQTFEDFDVIAVLDGCTDRSEEILMDLKDARFRVIRKERNEGQGPALRRIVEEAAAPLIARMDADDTMEPQRLQRQFQYLREHPEVSVVGTWFDLINESGRRIRSAFPFPTTHEEIRRDFRVRVSIGGSTAVYRAEAVQAVGGHPCEYYVSLDTVLWLRLLAAGFRFGNIPEVLYHYRRHGSQVTARLRREQLSVLNAAHRQYGPLIWGADAPDVEFGAPLGRRVVRKIRRLIRGRP